MRTLSILFILFGLSIFSCKDLSPEEQLAEDIRLIKEYLAKKGLTAEETSSGLHYIITKEGTGGHPNTASNVTVKYKGYTLDDAVFEETGSDTVTFTLGGLIQGWVEGIPKLKKGGKGTFFLPSVLAYGPEGSGSIDGNAVLIFEIELVNF